MRQMKVRCVIPSVGFFAGLVTALGFWFPAVADSGTLDLGDAVDRSDPGFHRQEGLLFLGIVPFTGTTVSYDSEGRLQRRETYLSGGRHGLFERFDAKGRLLDQRHYRNNRKDGVHQAWYANGQRRFEATFQHGVYEGVYREWFANGERAAEFRYEKGEEMGLQRTWDADGGLRGNYVVRDGRRYGLIGAKPCVAVSDSDEDVTGSRGPTKNRNDRTNRNAEADRLSERLNAIGAETRLPFYQDGSFTPEWIAPDDPAYPLIHRVAPLLLTDQEGRSVDEAQLTGKIRVVGFFFTSCSGICATMTRNLATLQAALPESPDVRLLSVSVMPSVDTSSVLKAYGAEYGVDSRRWQLLTGERALIYDLARRSYFADAESSTGEDPGDLIHSEKLTLIDPLGRIRGVYNGTLAFDLRRLREDIAILQREGAGANP